MAALRSFDDRQQAIVNKPGCVVAASVVGERGLCWPPR
jgi:hypothetical protein